MEEVATALTNLAIKNVFIELNVNAKRVIGNIHLWRQHRLIGYKAVKKDYYHLSVNFIKEKHSVQRLVYVVIKLKL